jgi:DNA-binding LytR/AlgR family response regulator
MESIKLKIKNILMNALNQNCTVDEIDSLSDKMVNFYQENKLIPLKNDQNEIVWVNIEDIIYIQKLKNKIEYHTIDASYLHHNKDQLEIEDLVFNHNFMMGDSRVVVNIPRVKKFDSYKMTLFFEDDVTQDSKKIITTQERLKMFKKILGSENDIVEKDNLAFTPNYNKKPLTN